MAATASRRLLGLYGACFCVSLLPAVPAAGQTFFREVTDEIGVGLLKSRGTAFGDYNNDDWSDLFLSESWGPGNQLLHNEGNGRFSDRTATIQAKKSPQHKGGGTVFGDYDNDGDLDLYVPVGMFLSSQREQNAFLRNDRGVLREVTLEVGLTDNLPTDNAIWLDYDRDGYIDLYTGNVAENHPETRNKLYRNDGDGTFTDVTREAGLDVPLHEDHGGSRGGMAAGDFNNDGWPDLYVGSQWSPNRLFLNDGQGGFWDATTDEIGDPGEALGVAVGDIDNDGDLDIFQPAGIQEKGRSLMLLNRGDGQFLDVTEGVGLAGLGVAKIWGAGLADIDNDGDLDLLTAPVHLYLNNGGGIFVDGTSQSGIANVGHNVSFGDYDLDGFQDVLFGTNSSGFGVGGLYRNNGNNNHWLQVELVGIESNRSGIGTRLIATSDSLVQMREMLGGRGFEQDDLVAHFGLGQRTRIDRLEIRWPSGQGDVLRDIPADQKIRVFEGHEAYHVVHPTTWQHNAPDSVVVGATFEWDATVQTALFEKNAEIVRVKGDLNAFGGPSVVPLVSMGDGAYRLDSTTLAVEGPTGFRTISVTIEQETGLGSYWTHLPKTIAVVPATDRVILSEGLSEGWQVESQRGAEPPRYTNVGPVYSGEIAAAFQVKPESEITWRVVFLVDPPIRLFGYTSLRFAFHPGDAEHGRFSLFLKGETVSLLMVDMDVKEWQEVEIPLYRYEVDATLEEFRLLGTLEGTFYLDDIRLVAATPPPSATAVTEDHTATLPQTFTLEQNYPNPFNSSTVIRFALPTAADVELAIFNLAGQQVATLVQGVRAAGEYTVNWDGTDENGNELASGVYLYRLWASKQQVETRKLLLLR